MKPKIPHLDRKSRVQSYKAILITFFTLVQIQGILSLALGIWLFVKIKIFTCIFLDNYYIGSALIMAAGCISIIMCTVGITRTLRYNTFPMLCHFILVYSVVLILEFSASIATTVNHDALHENFKQNLNSDFETVFRENLGGPGRSLSCWTEMQNKFRCCGFSSYKNWITYHSEDISQNIPKSGLESCACTPNGGETCIEVLTNNISLVNNYVYSSSCYDKLMVDLEFESIFLRVYPPVLIVIQVVCFIVMSYFMSKLRNVNVIATYTVKNNDSMFSTDIITSRMDQCTL